jgi:hypothetical protein
MERTAERQFPSWPFGKLPVFRRCKSALGARNFSRGMRITKSPAIIKRLSRTKFFMRASCGSRLQRIKLL